MARPLLATPLMQRCQVGHMKINLAVGHIHLVDLQGWHVERRCQSRSACDEADDHPGGMPMRNSLRHAFPSAPAAYRCGHNLLERGTSADLSSYVTPG